MSPPPTIGGERHPVHRCAVRSSVRRPCVNTSPHYTRYLCTYLRDFFYQTCHAEIFVMTWVGIAEKISKSEVKGQGHIKAECIFQLWYHPLTAVRALYTSGWGCISAMWRRGSLLSISGQGWFLKVEMSYSHIYKVEMFSMTEFD